VAFFGLNLTVLKIVEIAFFLMSLGIFAWSFKDEIPLPLLAGALLILGFNPYFWDIKDNVLSDLPFLFFIFLWLWFIQRSYAFTNDPRKRGWRSAVAAGLLMYLAFGTRSVGAVLVPALFIFEFIRLRRLTFYPVIAIAVFGILWGLQRLAIPGSDGYGDQLVVASRSILTNLHLYVDSFFTVWANGYFTPFQIGLFVVLVILAGVGLLRGLKKGLSIYEVFAILYLGTIIVWRANQGMRFLIPLMPLFVLYVCRGLIQIGHWATHRVKWIAATIVLVAILFSYAGVYSQTAFGPFNEGVETRNAQDLFSFIRQNTQPGEAFMFIWPRALALYADRPAVGYTSLENELFNLDLGRKNNIHYVVVKKGEDYLRLLVKHYPELFVKVYSNPDFSMYRFQPG
jgi:hypothetical protein